MPDSDRAMARPTDEEVEQIEQAVAEGRVPRKLMELRGGRLRPMTEAEAMAVADNSYVIPARVAKKLRRV